jgi:8-oxo-dGTP diphosphatase
MSESEVLLVTAAVIVKNGNVLITRRAPGGRHPGAWEFPGGKVEPGEAAAECLSRELAEELGVEVEVGEKLTEVRHAYPDITVDLIAYRCSLLGGTPRNIDCAAHEWVPPGKLDEYDLLPPDRIIAARVFGIL